MYYGTVLGALIGLSVGVLLGHGWTIFIFTPVGAFLGLRLDLSRRSPEVLEEAPPYAAELTDAEAHLAQRPADDAEKLQRTRAALDARRNFAEALCGVFVAVARVDGELERDEVRVVREFFEQELRYSPGELDAVRFAIKDALAVPPDLTSAIFTCRGRLSPAERVLFLNALYEMALADKPLTRAESDALKQVGAGLDISEEDQRSIRNMHLGGGLEHYAALGVAQDVSDDELRRAYKRLVALHHPDKVAHLGPGAMARAQRRFQEIQDAWAEVRKLRGL